MFDKLVRGSVLQSKGHWFHDHVTTFGKAFTPSLRGIIWCWEIGGDALGFKVAPLPGREQQQLTAGFMIKSPMLIRLLSAQVKYGSLYHFCLLLIQRTDIVDPFQDGCPLGLYYCALNIQLTVLIILGLFLCLKV